METVLCSLIPNVYSTTATASRAEIPAGNALVQPKMLEAVLNEVATLDLRVEIEDTFHGLTISLCGKNAPPLGFGPLSPSRQCGRSIQYMVSSQVSQA